MKSQKEVFPDVDFPIVRIVLNMEDCHQLARSIGRGEAWGEDPPEFLNGMTIAGSRLQPVGTAWLVGPEGEGRMVRLSQLMEREKGNE